MTMFRSLLVALLVVFITLPVSPLATPSFDKRRNIITIQNQHHISEPLVTSEDDNDVSYHDCIDNLRLIQTSEFEEGEWVTEDQIFDLIRAGVKFMDITDHLELGTTIKVKKSHEFPVSPVYQAEVLSFIANLTTKYMEANLKKFTSFRNRYYRSDTGKKSSEWLYKQILRIINDAGDGVDVSVRKFKHHWEQRSIIARFEGSDTDLDDEVVIIGAHQDSINMWLPSFGRAPGADDDGSGTVTILEAFRVLVEGGFKPVRPVEFHWYSAEEAGLLGSQDIARDYEKEGKDVVAMLQNDMTGYVGNKPETFGIIVDYVDADLTNFAKSLVETYASIPWHDTKCGYACSDHASWRKAGYPSAFAIESEFHNSNPYIHTVNDVVDNLSFEHMLEFSKLSVSFAVELSHI